MTKKRRYKQAVPKKTIPLFDDTYIGRRWTYGMTYRPLQIGAQPKGWIVGTLREHPEFRHGSIQYPRPLTPDEIESYELTEIKGAS